MDRNRFRGISLGMVGGGALFVAISLLVEDPYWFLVTGTVFVAIGLVVFFTRGR